jgi:hypothetical protein
VHELASAHALFVEWVEERIETTRLWLEYQNRFTAGLMAGADSAVQRNMLLTMFRCILSFVQRILTVDPVYPTQR